MKTFLKAVGCVFIIVIFFGLFCIFNSDSKKTYNVVASYKGDLGCTFMDFVKSYNEYITKENIGSAYEDYIIGQKSVKQEVHENGIVEITCALGKDNYPIVTVYLDSQSEKIKEIGVSGFMLYKDDDVYYASVATNVINAVVHDQYLKNNQSIKNSHGYSVLINSLDFFKYSFINDYHSGKVTNDKITYSLLTVPSSSSITKRPHVILSISPYK